MSGEQGPIYIKQRTVVHYLYKVFILTWPQQKGKKSQTGFLGTPLNLFYLIIPIYLNTLRLFLTFI